LTFRFGRPASLIVLSHSTSSVQVVSPGTSRKILRCKLLRTGEKKRWSEFFCLPVGQRQGPLRGGLAERVCGFAHSLHLCGCVGCLLASARPLAHRVPARASPLSRVRTRRHALTPWSRPASDPLHCRSAGYVPPGPATARVPMVPTPLRFRCPPLPGPSPCPGHPL
jgi:hypothetical protein